MSVAPEISVVMANYNGGRYLAAAIKSVQSQTFKSWELIMVDDASGDASVAVAETASDGDERVKIICQPSNGGVAAARNRAIGLARGKWIAVFDSDDLMRPQRLGVLLDRARTDRALIVADNMLVFSANASSSEPFLSKRLTKVPRWIGLAEYIDSNRLYSRLPDLGYLKPLINADALRSAGVLYDERLRIGEDYDFMARLLARGPKLRIEPSALYLYRRHAESTSHRMRGDHIVALIDADARFVRDARPLDSEEALALRRRTQSLNAMLLYDRVIGLLKARRYGQAARLSVSAPRIWPLLTRPVRARISRLRSLGRRTGTAADETALDAR